MKFGLFYELQLPTPWRDGDEERMFRETLEHVELAERLGFDCIWGVEHHFLEDHSLSSSPGTWLAAAAARTKRIRIGHGIACTPPSFVHPARLAEQVATLDLISGGRVEFGTGESASRMELEGYAVDPATKHAAWEEAVGAIADMMAMKPYPGLQGEHFAMPCRNVIPKPAQKPHPPLWVAGKPDLAARHGLGCLGFNVMSGEMAKAAVDSYYDRLVRECVPLGRAVNANIAVLATTHVHRDRATALERGDHLKFFAYSVAEYYVKGAVKPGRVQSWDAFDAMRARMPPMGADNPTSAIGTPDDVRKHIRVLEAAGVDQVLLMHQGGRMRHEWDCESLELFAREIMPEFQEREAARAAAKADRLAPAIAAAMTRKQWRAELADADIPVIEPYGKASFIPEGAGQRVAGASAETRGALGLGAVAAE